MPDESLLQRVLEEVRAETMREFERNQGDLEALIAGLVTFADRIEEMVARDDEKAGSQFREGINGAIEAFEHLRRP